MLQTLLSPLRSQFELSPRSPSSSEQPEQPNPSTTHPEDDDLNPEEFARDVLIELTRKSVEKLMINGIKERYMFWLEVSGSKSKAAMIGCRPWPRDHYLISVLRRPSTNDLQVTIQVMSAAERASQTWVCCFFGGWFFDCIDHFFIIFIGICLLLLSRTETIEYYMDSD